VEIEGYALCNTSDLIFGKSNLNTGLICSQLIMSVCTFCVPITFWAQVQSHPPRARVEGNHFGALVLSGMEKEQSRRCMVSSESKRDPALTSLYFPQRPNHPTLPPVSKPPYASCCVYTSLHFPPCVPSSIARERCADINYHTHHQSSLNALRIRFSKD